MPRRKQDCPKRMKWELENLGAFSKESAAGPSSAQNDEGCDGDSSEISEDEEDKETDRDHSLAQDGPDTLRMDVDRNSPPMNGNKTSSRQTDSIECQIESPLDLSVSHIKSGIPKKHAKLKESRLPWNGKFPNSDLTSKALEKMSEMSCTGSIDSAPVTPSKGSTSSWQAQWLAQSACGTKDVLRCVCCRLTFPSLSALSIHMKDAKHGPPISSPKSPSTSVNMTNHTNNTSNDSSLLLKETVHLPRKLVRGQDVWLGKGAEQTRQILKCMWCGQSFRSLAEMTSHMQQTQHYTNIISQEQLISWRSHEDKSTSASSHVSAVLTCKVCDQAFSSLKELSNHMVKNSHYKEHIMRSITESGSRRRQSREKRKKSLPVRKLLELERANTGTKKEILIACEKCSEKIAAPSFVEHLRICEKTEDRITSTKINRNLSDSSAKQEKCSKDGDDRKEPSSVLNAIEKMIEKSFDYQAKGVNLNTSISSPIGTSSILKRLGIDESADYTKPIVDPSLISSISSSRPSLRSRSVSSDTAEPTTPSCGTPHNSVSDSLDERTPSEEGQEEKNEDKDDAARNRRTPTKQNSLSALNSMFELIGGGQEVKSPNSTGAAQTQNSQHSSPISALQKFCDRNEGPVTTGASRPTSRTSASSNPLSPATGIESSAMLGLNWSTAEGDNVFKCNFCETPFLSKGAYRHHLAKMHFVKDKSPAAKEDNQINSDSPTSKFIKYSELAKQLSSK